MTFSRWRWFVALSMVGACGGGVVVDTNGGAEGGGGGKGGGGGGGAVGLPACTEWCEAYTAQCSDMETCMDHCVERVSYMGPCKSEYEALLLCIAAHPPLDPQECGTFKIDCEGKLDAVKACVYPAGPCEVGQCKAGGGFGAASMTCDFACGDVVYTSLCGKVGETKGFPMDCECQIDGETIGTCQSVTSEGSTSLGCCSASFAESE